MAVVGALLFWLCRRSKDDLIRPWPAWVLLALAGWTAMAVVPIPGLRGVVAPELQAWVAEALGSADVRPTPGLSVRPADTGMESIRLVGLAGLTLAAAQLSWRLSAAAVAGCGSTVACIGFVHTLVDATKIYGLYAPHDVLPGTRTALMGTFVNPNHQSGLLLLALFAAAALAVDQLDGARTARDAARAEQRRDRGLAMLAAIAVLLPALLLSLSRGALLALAIVGPIGLVLAVRRVPAERGSKSRRVRRGPMILGVSALVGLTIAIGRHGAWRELITLFDDPAAVYEEKLGPAIDALPLIGRSPLAGTGRGTFIDLFALENPGRDRVFTHLESVPVTALVEWGPLVGGAVLLAGLWWWARALHRQGSRRERKARALLLLGVLALALQALVDFSLEFIGVAAPLLALVGALTPHGRARIHRRWLERTAPVVGLVGALGVLLLAPHTWTRGAATDQAVAEGVVDVEDALRWRPLDGGLHAVAARRALERGDLKEAVGHAAFATRVRPGSIDAWLMLSETESRLGDRAGRDSAFAAALDRVHTPAPPELIAYLLRRYPDPEQVEPVTPSRLRGFSAVIRGLREAGAPAHADAMAEHRSRTHLDDPVPLLVRSQLAAERRNGALALHFAQLARATDPAYGGAHLAVVRATVLRDGPIAGLAALDAVPLGDLPPRDRAQLEELRVRLLLQRGDPPALDEARRLAEELLLHSPDEATRKRRRELVRATHDEG